MAEHINCQWTGKMSFKSTVNGHDIILDADDSVGGENKGPRPKPLLLVALAGCTGMDVVSILSKMRVAFDDVNVEIEAEMTDEHPKVYSKIHIIYNIKGKDLPMAKVERAVQLSQENYCGVSAMLKKASDLSFEIKAGE